MISLFFLPLTLIWGALLGIVYFGGLWLTVRKLPKVDAPMFLAIGSFIMRLGIVLAGFSLLLYFAQDYAPLHLLGCLVTFFLVRNHIINKFYKSSRRLINAS